MRKSRLIQTNLSLLAFLLISFSGIAQRKITGVVEDVKTNSPLEGATITVKDSKTSTISKIGGQFTITVPDGTAILEISFVGYDSKSTTIGSNQTNIEIKLNQSENNQLSDVVVVGYGTQKKIDVTGAVDQISGKSLAERPIANVFQGLQGVSPGLNITYNGGQPGH